MDKEIEAALEKLSEEAKELYLLPKIPILDGPPSPLVFFRDYVSKNRPVVIKNALESWPALNRWSSKYLKNTLGSTQVTVTVTPDGYADAPVGEYFVLPEERLMSFEEFLEIWERKKNANGVFYIQKQNSNFVDEFDQLIADADSHIAWATEAFGTKPDAVNFWMGNARSVTSMHKDHYENLYAVVRGQKTFILHPPTDIHRIPYRTYKIGNYKENSNGAFEIIEMLDESDATANCNGITDHMSGECLADSGRTEPSEHLATKSKLKNQLISWIAVDPLSPDYESYPQYAKCQKYIAEIGAGDLLYLPSLWFHHVTQTDQTIAVNFWYDMEYDIKYNYFRFTEEVSKIVSKSTSELQL